MPDDNLPPSLRSQPVAAPSPSAEGPPSLRDQKRPGIPALAKSAIDAFFSVPPMAQIGTAMQIPKAGRLLRQAEQMSQSGLRQLAEMVPEPNTASPTANVVLGAPRVAAETMAEFAPGFISPEAATLGLAGPVAGPALGGLAKSKAVRSAVEALPPSIRKVGGFIKKAFTTRIFGGDPVAERLAERAGITIAKGEEKAVEVGKLLQKGLGRPERLRLGQIVRGGVSVSKKEIGLRMRADRAREVIDDLEQQAVRLRLIPEDALNRLTRRGRASVRTRIRDVESKISRLENFQQLQKDRIAAKAGTLRIQGVKGLANRIDKAEKPVTQLQQRVPEYKELLGGQTFDGIENILEQSSLRRNQTVSRLLTRFSSASIGKQEELMEKLLTVAKRAGMDVQAIREAPLSIANFKGLLTRVQSLPSMFPGQKRAVSILRGKAQELQEKLADSYTASGQKYLPRLFLNKEFGGPQTRDFGFSPLRVPKQRFMKRDFITEDIRKAMGEIREPALPAAKGILQVSKALANTRFFNQIAANPNWAVPKTAQVVPPDFVKMPDSPGLGKLAGQYLHPEMAKDLLQTIKAPSAAQKLWDSFISKWKFGKVVLNPSTHFRNIMSNTILMDISGISHVEQPRLLLQAVREMKSNGALFQRAKNLGLFGREFVGGEVKAFEKNLLENLDNPDLLNRSARLARGAMESFGNAYQKEEQVFKLATFIKLRESGLPAREAVKQANAVLFDYTKVSPVVGYLRKAPFGSPFITFTAKAIPRIAETAVTNPLALYKYQMLFDAIEQVALDRGVITPEERDTIKRTARGQNVILPAKDEAGLPYVLDLTYIMPWGDVGERGGLFGLPSAAPPTGPLRAIIEAGMNHNVFTEKPIYLETDTKGERVAKVSDFLMKTMLPSLTPGIDTEGSPFRGGFSFQKLNSAILRKPDFMGRVRTIPNVLLDVGFGLKARPTDPAMQQFFEMNDIRKQMEEIETDLKKKMRHPGISAKEKDRLQKSFARKANRIAEGPKSSDVLRGLREKLRSPF